MLGRGQAGEAGEPRHGRPAAADMHLQAIHGGAPRIGTEGPGCAAFAAPAIACRVPCVTASRPGARQRPPTRAKRPSTNATARHCGPAGRPPAPLLHGQRASGEPNADPRPAAHERRAPPGMPVHKTPADWTASLRGRQRASRPRGGAGGGTRTRMRRPSEGGGGQGKKSPPCVII